MIARIFGGLSAAVRRRFCQHAASESYASTTLTNQATGRVVSRDYRRCLACGATWCSEQITEQSPAQRR